MKLEQIEFREINIPFRMSFTHSSATRSSTEGILAEVRCRGFVGYGEGCPRSYVTGETLSSGKLFLNHYRSEILRIDSYPALSSWVTTNRKIIDRNPAAWCAVEMAILDLLGKLEGVTIEKVLGLNAQHLNYRYSAIVGVESPELFSAFLKQYDSLGMKDFKVKVGGDIEIDCQNLRLLAETIPEARVRIDANNLWCDSDEARKYIIQLPVNIWAVEEPLKAGDYTSLEQLSQNVNCRLILDESLLVIEQLQQLLPNRSLWVPNIRVSKMGGILRSIEFARQCIDAGFDYVIGAQVGETSLLTRAGMVIASLGSAHLIAQEGAFGTRLLTKDVTPSPLMFGSGGILSTGHLNQLPGLGIECNL